MAAALLYSAGIGTAKASHQHLSAKSSPLPPLHLDTTGGRRQRNSHVAMARRQGGLSSRTGRLEKRGKKGGGGATTTREEKDLDRDEAEEGKLEGSSSSAPVGGGMEYSTEPMPQLPGLEPDFWEGPQWDAFGFLIQYLWAFGILFGLISGGIAVATYNEGATDFRQSPVFKESTQSQELLEEPDASSTDVFEANPTETAPSLE